MIRIDITITNVYTLTIDEVVVMSTADPAVADEFLQQCKKESIAAIIEYAKRVEYIEGVVVSEM